MHIENIILSGFRNFKKQLFTFHSKKNLIFGNNGAGKTSVLEAIYLLSFSKSFLNSKKQEILNDQSDQFGIEMNIIFNQNKYQLRGEYNSNNIFQLHFNNKKSHYCEFNKYFFSVFFSSSTYNLLVESIPYFRKLVDRFIFGLNPIYLHYLLCYNQALKQKNHLLKKGSKYIEINNWNKILAEMSLKTIRYKLNFISQINKEIELLFSKKIKIEYCSSFNLSDTVSELKILEQLNNIFSKESKYYKALLGTHLDKFQIYFQDKPLRFYSSGERKLYLLFFYIAYISLFNRLKNEFPVFLFDDFDIAIDSKNLNLLFENYPGVQIIATSVHHFNKFDNFIELKKEN